MVMNDVVGADRHGQQQKVKVIVDGHPVEVRPGKYIVSAFKKEVGVPPEKELDQIIHGTLTPLDDNAEINIVGHEHFVSHERTGGSS